MKNKGFTLIEVMVVLSILAIIAILAYNFFGSTMKDASLTRHATKIYNDLRTLSDAEELCQIETGAWCGSVATYIANGYIKAEPKFNGADFGSANGSYTIQNAWYNYGGTATLDETILSTQAASAGYLEVCARYNKLYAPDLGEVAVTTNWNTKPATTSTTWCAAQSGTSPRILWTVKHL